MDLLTTLQERQFIDQISDNDGIVKAILEKKRVYIGFDPTADSLHLGNLVGIVALRWFELYGIEVVALVGGATGKIGDPSGKSTERPQLTEETISHNLSSIGAQLKNLLDNPIMVNNDEWFKSIGWIELLRDVGKHFRLGVMLAKEMVKTRLHSDEGISFTEFSYQIMQAYDFCVLAQKHNVAIQMGGSDQWGNIVSGIDLARKMLSQEVYGITFPLLTRSDGKKFGKSEGGAIWLSKEKCSPYKFYQYLLQVADADVIQLLRMLTFLDMNTIRKIQNDLESGNFPGNAQKILAAEVTKFVHGEEGLDLALSVTKVLSPGADADLRPHILRAVENDMPSVTLSKDQAYDKTYAELACFAGLFSSKGEANRLLANGGAVINNQKIENEKQLIEEAQYIESRYLVICAGKKKKVLIKVE